MLKVEIPIWVNDIDDTTLSMPFKATLEVVTAIFCGLIVGQERERKEKPAGLRTMTLICMGSTLFTIVSITMATSQYNDPARLAAQIVTGVGFLGAGVIMRDGIAVTGLTTAATIWLTAALGVMVGCGYCVPAIASAITALLMLHGLNYFDRDWLNPHNKVQNWIMEFDNHHGLTDLRIKQVFSTHNVKIIKEEDVNESGYGATVCIVFQICNHSRHHTQMLSELTDIDGIKNIHKIKVPANK